MGFSQAIFWVLTALAVILLMTVASYAVSRAASIAHYRTKLEYVRSLFRGGAKSNGR